MRSAQTENQSLLHRLIHHRFHHNQSRRLNLEHHLPFFGMPVYASSSSLISIPHHLKHFASPRLPLWLILHSFSLSPSILAPSTSLRAALGLLGRRASSHRQFSRS